MKTRSSRADQGNAYVFKFVAVASLLIAGTLALVLYVLPERYVLSSGFREGNLNLPNPAIPFEPASPLRVAAIPGISRTVRTVDVPRGPVRGPSEVFWERVLPLLEAGRYEEALPLFTDYLARHSGDVGVRREYAITLAAAGRPDRAIPILQGLLVHEDDDALHLLLARLLRDRGRVDEAAEHYRVVLERNPENAALSLEWARALSWITDFEAAEEVLLEALERDPESTPLRAELARVYYYAGRMEESRRILDALTAEERRLHDLVEVHANVVEWLTPPADTVQPVPEPEPTLLERAVRAREDDDFERADSLFRAALAAEPESAEAWQAYADFLQYELEDFEGALTALKEVERLRDEPSPTLQYRMARLELWTDRTDAARARLERLLGMMPAEAADAGPAAEPADTAAADVEAHGGEVTPPTRADVLALLGDLHRWDGRRLAAAERYEAALEADPDHEAATEGLEVLRAELERFLFESEQPGLGALARSLADTDDFRRYDAAGSWTGVRSAWVWTTRSGGRWLEGLEPAGGLGSRQGLFAELEGGRWWRWGTLRTAAHLGVQNVRSNSVDVSAGASLRVVGSSGRRTELRLDHEPAYEATRTLQSVAADVRQDRVTLSHSRPLSERWSAAVTAEAASLDHRGVAGSERNLRLQLAASLGRSLSRSVTLGLSGRALRYVDPAPDLTAVPLYWDPALSVSMGPYLRLLHALDSSWSLAAEANPGLAYIDERDRPTELVPDLSGRLGLVHETGRYRTRVDVFYGQGRFSGYRSYGVDISFSARSLPGSGPGS